MEGRPCIGLVLGGGGARGGAHIGVLQVLEELQVPVDVIAGTSIGAIVGGLYSTGLTADEIAAVTASLDWEDLFRPSPPRDDLAYRRKQDDVRFPVQLELGLGTAGVKLPRGLITGQSLHVLLSGFGVPVGSVVDFDALPIPFRAVAADLSDGTPIALAGGDLARAIRASMSVPGVFVPVEIDGRLLVDGGVSQNVPVSVVQAMGADIVIAVDVATPPDPIESLTTAVGISRQIVRFPIQRATRAELDRLGSDDVVIVPDLTGIGSTDFPSALDAALAGMEAAREHGAPLRTLALSQPEYSAWRSHLAARRGSVPLIEDVRLNNPSSLSDRQLRGLIRQQVGSPFDAGLLTEDIARIYGLGFFESVTYRVEGLAARPSATDAGRLVIDVVPEPWGPHYLRFGVGFRDDLGGNSAFGFLTSYTLTQLNGWGAEWRNELQLGRERRLFSEWYQPFGGGGVVFVAPQVEYQRDILDVYRNDTRTSQRRRTRATASVELGVRLGNWGEVRAGIVRGDARLETRTGVADSTDSDDAVGALRSSLSIDRLDDRGFPRHGDALEVTATRSLDALGGESSYSRVHGRALRAFPAGAGTVLLRLEGGTSLGDSLPAWDHFAVGGLFGVSGLRERARTGTEAVSGGLVFYRPIASLPTTLAGGDLLVGISVEAGNAWGHNESVNLSELRVGGSAFVGLETVLGPIQLGYGRADAGQGAWYLFLGRTF